MDTLVRIASAQDPHTTLRMPAQLMEHIDACARRNGRSRNSEILERIWRTVLQEDGLPETESQ